MIWERCSDKSENAAAKARRSLAFASAPAFALKCGDRGLHVSDGNAALRHLRLQVRNVALVAPVLRVEIELRPGPDGGERKSGRLDLLAGPVRIGLSFELSERRRREQDHGRNRENGASRSKMHLRFLLSAMIRLGLRPIKPPRFTIASPVAPLSVGKRAC